MQEQNEAREPSGLEQTAAVASQVRGAIKTGKAISGAAQGIAAGNPLGAAFALWQNRKTAIAAVAVIALLLALPLLFITLLPSVIFGGLNASYETPILNNDAQILQNISESEQALWNILTERHEAVLAEISDKIAALEDNCIGIIEDVEFSQINLNCTLLLSQYSASRVYSEISIENLIRTVRANATDLFTYRVVITTTSDDKGNIIYIFTYHVVYAGESYFSDHIFQLDESGRALANQYAQNLALHLYGSNFQGGVVNVSQDVLQYSAIIRQYAEFEGIGQYFDLLCAVMMAESGGRGSDPMQSSEGPFNTRYPQKPNAIQDPIYSIECGVKELASCLRAAGCTSPNDRSKLSLALQGYNYGNGYIDWAVKNYGGYSEANAVEFSNMMKAKLGWSVYGNPRYVSAVFRYYAFGGVGPETGWGSPFVGRDWRLNVTSEFGNRIHPVTGEVGKFHSGIDIAFPRGTPINAVRSGIVEKAVESSTGYGWHIVIDHGGGVKTLYGHCSELLVSAGQSVRQGQVIARVGSTGLSTGSHLHLNVEIHGELQNSRQYIP